MEPLFGKKEVLQTKANTESRQGSSIAIPKVSTEVADQLQLSVGHPVGRTAGPFDIRVQPRSATEAAAQQIAPIINNAVADAAFVVNQLQGRIASVADPTGVPIPPSMLSITSKSLFDDIVRITCTIPGRI